MKIQESFYERYNKNAVHRIDHIKDVVKFILPEGDNLLDIGCSVGNLMLIAKDKYEKIYGIDISEVALSKAKKLGYKTKKVDLERDKIPFENDFFDCVVCLEVIEHVMDPEKLLLEIKRVMKRGGIAIISTPNIRFLKNVYDLAVRGTFMDRMWAGHIRFFTYRDMIKLAKSCGFKITGIYGTCKGRYFLKEFLSRNIVLKLEK